MADTATMLLQDKSILEFLEMLNGSNMQSKASEYADFFSSIDAMQNQLNETLNELKNVRKQLDAIGDRKNPIKKAFTDVVDKLQKELQVIQSRLNELKEKLITAAKNAVQGVKEKGQAALNGILKFFGIKQELQNTIKASSDVIESCNKSIAKIEAISNEYHAVGMNTRNFGRAVIGKEAVQDQKQKGKLAKALQSIVRFRKNISVGFKRKCENAITKLENLESTVSLNRERAAQRKLEKKPSLMKRIENHKQTIQNKQSPEKSKEKGMEL